MRSSDVARLAGVSVRTLRHYHQVGVLAEPARSSNGYRDYDVHDLIRLLRIRRLAALGIPLERMPLLLDEPGEDADTLLDDLDRELAERAEAIERQRAVIARLRADRTAPDLPPELAPFLATLAVAGQSPELVRFDRDQTVLLAHLVGEEGMPQLRRCYERLSAPDLAPAAIHLSEQFAALGPAADDQEIDVIVDHLVVTFGPVLRELEDALPGFSLTDSAHLLDTHTADQLNPAQLRLLQRAEARLVDSWSA